MYSINGLVVCRATFKRLMMLSVFFMLLPFLISGSAALEVDNDNDIDTILLSLESVRTQSPQFVTDSLSSLSQNFVKFNQEQKYRFILLRAHSYALSGKSDEAINLLKNELYKKFHESHLKYKTRILYLLANTYSHFNQYADALQTLHLLLPLLSDINDIESEVYGYTLATELFGQIQLNDEALQYAEYLLQKFDSIILPRHKCFASFNYAESYNGVYEDKKESWYEIKNLYQVAYDHCNEASEKMIMAVSLLGRASIFVKLHDLKKARETVELAIKLSMSVPYALDIAEAHILYSQIEQLVHQPSKALKHVLIAMNIAEEQEEIQLLARTNKLASELYEELGQTDKALESLKLYQKNYSKVLGETQSKIIAFETTKLDYLEKERQIRYLNKDRELYTAKAALTESQRRNERMMNTLIFGGLVVLAIFALVMTMQKRKYKQLAQHDALTGIFNRGTAQNIAENSFIKTLSKRERFSVIMFDLDYFKRINDYYGHGTGDWVLKKVAEVINKASRSDDIFARFGGEEFALFLPNTDEADANTMAEEYRGLIQSIETRFSGHNFDLTASFGVSTSSEDDLSLDPLLHRADIAMYHSKAQGRNCVTRYKPEIEQSRSGYQKSKMALG